MVIADKIIGVIADIGVEAAKKHFANKLEEIAAREKLEEYIARQAERNFDCSVREEIDFEGLAGYIRSDLIDDVQLRLFGSKKERETARNAIADKAAYYAQAKTKLSEERARHFAFDVVDILKKFFRSKVERKSLLVASEIEDTVISEMTDQHKNQEQKFDALARTIQENSVLSIDRNISLVQAGKLNEVEENVVSFFAGIGTKHILAPYYGFTMDGVSHLKSIPLRSDAVKLFPPRIEITATNFEMDGQPLPDVDANIFTRAYETQSTISFNVAAIQKYLGNVLDPIQHEVENLSGTKMFLKPPSFPPALPCSVLVDGETAIDYLLLRIKRIEKDGTMIITNDEQKKCRFKVSLAINSTKTNVVLSVTPDAPSNSDLLRYRLFLKKAMVAKRISLKALEHNVIVLSTAGNLVAHDYENLDSEIEFLQKVVAIEQHFHIALAIPEKVEDSDHLAIDRLYSMINDGKYCGTCRGFTMSFNLTEELRHSICTIGEMAFGFACNLGMHVELFDQGFDFRIIRVIDSLKLESFGKMKRKLDVLDDGDSLKVPFISGETGSDIHYSDMFYSEDAAKQFLRKPTD